jgi:hypothetical protein
MITTAISNSINEKPRALFIVFPPMFDSPAAPCQMRAFGDKRSLPADRRHKKAQATRPILQQGLSSALTRLDTP